MRRIARFMLFACGVIVLAFAAVCACAAIYYGWIAECVGLIDCKDVRAVVASFILVGFPSGLVGLGAVLAARAMK